jgi:hypothetical protein
MLFILNQPFARMAKLTGGLIDGEVVAGLLLIANGRFWRGLGACLRAFRANRRANRATARRLGAAAQLPAGAGSGVGAAAAGLAAGPAGGSVAGCVEGPAA